MQFGIALFVCAALVCQSECRGYKGLFSLGQFQRRGTDMPLPMTTEMPMSVTDDEVMGWDIEDWPFAVMEFSSLVGRCVTARLMWSMHKKPTDGILVHACPYVIQAAKHYAEADEPTRERAEDFAEEVFHLLQCVNLAAEFESTKVMEYMTKLTTGDVFRSEAKELFNMCERVFDNAEEYLEKWTTEFDMELTHKRPATRNPVDNDNEPSLDYLLRKALAKAVIHR